VISRLCFMSYKHMALVTSNRLAGTSETAERALVLFSSVTDVVRFVVAFLCLLLVFKSSVLEAFFVPSSSMSPTLREQDYILVPKFSYGLRLPFLSSAVTTWAEPLRGDVIVFKRSDDPRTVEDESEKAFVKRVVAVGGDIVEVRNREVFINGIIQTEPFAEWGVASHRKDFSPRKVPLGALFVLGDNRDESQDSRFWSTPFVRTENVLGRAMYVYAPRSGVARTGRSL
jgi:signal peptidase I